MDQSDDRLNLSEQAYQHLRSLIIEQVLTPGVIVSERGLAEELNASRTPLRAAIGRLEGEGLVERLSNGSLIIRQVSTDELLEISPDPPRSGGGGGRHCRAAPGQEAGGRHACRNARAAR